MNNLFFPNIATYLSIGIVVTTLLYLLGHLLMTWFPQDRKSTTLSKNSYSPFLGLTLIVSIFAIIYTKGSSIFWIPLISFLVFILVKKKQIKYSPYPWSYKTLFLFIGLEIIFTLLAYYFFFINSNGAVHSDFVYYTKNIDVIANTHVESDGAFLNLHYTAVPYHYFESWFSLILVKLLSLHITYTLLFIVYPTLFSIFFVLGYNLSLKFTNKKTALFFGTLLLISTPIFKYTHFCALVTYPKLVTVYIIFAYLFIFYFEKRKNLILLLVGCSAAIFTPISPVLILSYFFTNSIYLYIHTHSISKALFNYTNIYMISVSLIVLLFYSLPFLTTPHITIQTPNLTFDFIRSTKWFVMKFLKFSLSLSPFLLLLFMKRVRDYIVSHLNFCFSIIIVSIIALLSASILKEDNIDAVQLFYSILRPLLSMLVFLIIIYFFNTTKYKTLFLIIVSSILVCNQYIHPSLMYIATNTNINKKEIFFYKIIAKSIDSQSKIGFIRNNEIKNEYREDFNNPLNKLVHCTKTGNFDYFWIFPIDSINVPILDPLNDGRKESQLYLYCTKKNLDFTEFNTLQFIINKKIQYIIVEREASLPAYLKPYCSLKTEYDHNLFYKFTYR